MRDLGDEAHAGIDEERDAADHAREVLLGDFARAPDLVEHRLGGGEREGQLLRRRRSRLLQMVGADIGRVPFRHLARGVDDHVLDQPQRRRRREDVGPAREILFQNVVLHRAGKLGLVGALLLGERRIEREQPGGGGVDGHRGVHLGQRDALEQAAHVAEMGDRHADLADLAARQRMVGIVAGLGRQIEGDRKSGLALGEVAPVKLVGGGRRRMSRIGAEQPGLVSFAPARCHRFLPAHQYPIEARPQAGLQPTSGDFWTENRHPAPATGAPNRTTASAKTASARKPAT